VIRNADFEADLSNLRTGAVKKMTVDASVGNRDLTLELGGWNFKDMGKSIKDLSQHVADKLFASFK
jgi:hypothetical protein